MIDVTLETHHDLYFDYRKCLDFIASKKKEDHKYPEGVTYFHLYTEVKTDKELLAVTSYLATQNLDKTKLIVWSDYDITDQANIQPYKDFVDFRVYNPRELAKGTPLEGMESHLNPGGDQNHWMSSGIMRFLVLYKFGGVYFDMDMVLLDDFKPILGQDFAYQWGGSTDFSKERRWEPDCHGPCAAMLGAVKGSQYIKDCMEQLIKTPATGGTCYDEDMLGYVYAMRPFTVFPSPFFNTEWLMSKTDKPLSEEVESSWFSKPLKDETNLFLEAFAWHWHNSSNKSKDVVEGSKFDLLRKLTDKRLEDRGFSL